MDEVTCRSCNRVVAEPPSNRGVWALVVSFWAFSLLFGVGAAVGSGWSFMLLLAWVLLAALTALVFQRARAQSCCECGAKLRPRRETAA